MAWLDGEVPMMRDAGTLDLVSRIAKHVFRQINGGLLATLHSA